MNYPKIYMHRDNHAAQVVVANQQQEAELPADFVPLDGSPSGATGASPGVPLESDKKVLADQSGAANALSTGLADLEERRKEFDHATDQFAKHVRDTEAELTATREQLDVQADQIANDRKTLDQDRAFFEQQKAAKATTGENAEPANTANAPAKHAGKAKG